MSRRTALIALVAALVLAAGCVGGPSDDGGDAADMEGEYEAADRAGDGAADAATNDAVADDAETDGDETGETAAASAAVRDDRELIRTARLELEVGDFERTRANLTVEARERGGHPADSERTRHERGGESWTSGTLTYRVPAGEFEAFRTAVEREGEVLTASTEVEDVTDRLVDLEARIKNLERQRERLREQYDDAEDTEAVLAVEERLGEVQGRSNASRPNANRSPTG